MTRNKSDYELARDLVLAALIVLNDGRIPTDRGMIGQLQVYLNVNKRVNGDIRNLVSGINDPKRAAKIALNPTEVAAKRRALAIVESLRVESESGWVAPGIEDIGDTSKVSGWDEENMSEDEKAERDNYTDIQSETKKAKRPGRKPQNPVEAATQKKRSARTEEKCCN